MAIAPELISFVDAEAPMQDTAGAGRIAPAHSINLEADRVFNVNSEHDWLTLIRDVAAVANGGGGQILVRLVSGQAPDDTAGTGAATLTSSELVARLAQFTDSSFAHIQTRIVESDASAVIVEIGCAAIPIVFNKGGWVVDPNGRTKCIEVFPTGSFFVRHDGRIAPGTSADLRASFAQQLGIARRRWLASIRRILKRPIDLEQPRVRRRMHAAKRIRGEPIVKPVRIVNDPSAPALQPLDVDRLYPLRQKDLMRALNLRFGRRAVNSYDIQAIRRQHRLDERAGFVFHLPGAGRRYSPEVVEWIFEQHDRDPAFFQHARAADHEFMRLHRRKPR
jgi:hypothetical protein